MNRYNHSKEVILKRGGNEYYLNERSKFDFVTAEILMIKIYKKTFGYIYMVLSSQFCIVNLNNFRANRCPLID